jgi:DNA-binding HxlR family transcriptional regulator
MVHTAQEGVEGCPVDQVLRLLSARWTLYVLWRLQEHGPQRFNALLKLIPGVSQKVLTERLRTLETAGLVVRDYKPTVPPEVTYSLTERGAELHGTLHAIEAVSRSWIEAGWSPETGFAEGDCAAAAPPA